MIPPRIEQSGRAPSWTVLDDNDVDRLIDAADAVAKMEDALREHAAGTLIAPPRMSFDASNGALVFTAGAAEGAERAVGFRVYETISTGSTETDQLVVVYDSIDGHLKGVVLGGRIGALRTGALGGVAIKHLARPDAKVLSIIGAGFQARSQLEAALAVHSFERIIIASRTRASAERLQGELLEQHDRTAEVADSIRDAVSAADVLVTTSNSREPILDAAWIRPGTHVNMVGPKLAGAAEMPREIGDRISFLCSDSVQQVEAYETFFLAGGPHLNGLDEVVTTTVPGRPDTDAGIDAITLYVSVGLAGTEVVLANEVVRRARR